MFDDVDLINFLIGNGTNREGETYEDLLKLSPYKLEARHDFIQWIFPIDKRSQYNPDAPILTPLVLEATKGHRTVIKRLEKACSMMGRFYGFGLKDPWWVTPNNHNFLRITRIITSCRLLGEKKLAHDFYNEAKKIVEQSPEKYNIRVQASLKFWAEALK